MANENSVSTGWLLLYIVLALLVIYGTVAYVGGL
jgi:hypothetical protein